MIASVHGALAGAGAQPQQKSEPKAPAVNPKRSITPEYITCLEDGKKFKSLKRHLRTDHGMEPDQYREKWGLARDYPMVAPAYAQARSNLAKNMGLGRGGRAKEATPPPAPAPKKTTRGRKRAGA